MNINVEAFFNVLPVIGKGLAGVFIVTAVIILSMIILNKISGKFNKEA